VDWNNPVNVTLHLNMSSDSQKFRGFKQASFGTASEPIFSGRKEIYVKQIFTTKSKDVLNGAGKPVTLQQRFTVDRQAQLQGLLSKISCLTCGHALLTDMTYHFIRRHIATHREPPFLIPNMRFVRSALAYEQGGLMQVFLVEELIDEENKGIFRKYLHNGSANPLFPEWRQWRSCGLLGVQSASSVLEDGQDDLRH
jgi:hypothetical protein